MRAVIIEDEKLTAEHLQTLLKKAEPGIEIVTVLDSVKRCVEYFSKHKDHDLIFADIHLADGLSFELFNQLSIEVPVIFTTAYDEYALKAFKLNSVDYLLKPIDLKELKFALEKFKKMGKELIVKQKESIDNSFHVFTKQYKSRFMVKTGDLISSIKAEDVSHFVFEDGWAMLYSKEGKKYTLDHTLDQLEGLVDPALFFRINRKALININAIQKVNTYFNSRLKVSIARLEDEDGVVSRERVQDFKQWLDG